MTTKRRRWVYKDRPYQTSIYIKTSINIKLDIANISHFLFMKTDSFSWEWLDWTDSRIIKEYKSHVINYGLDSLIFDDCDTMEEDRWGDQPDFVQEWFYNEVAILFPYLDKRNTK